MQTIYYETSSFIRHEGNVVDLGAYRQKLAAVSGEDWSGVAERELLPPMEEDAAPLLTLVPEESDQTRIQRRRHHRVRRAGILLDLGASAAILLMTITAVVRFVQF